jgi:hypothetical protein
MATDNSKKASLKQKAVHELEEFGAISLYLAFFFCAVVTYSMLLLKQYQVPYYNYATALINALIVAKVILIGQYAHLGNRQESKPLFQSAIYKAFMFTLLVFAFHILEELIKRLWHGDAVAAASRNIRVDDLLARSLVVFCTFVPLFAFLELRRVLGEDRFSDLLFRTGATAKSDSSSER